MITIEVHQARGGELQVSINDQDETGLGHGYRIAGPKFSGDSKLLVRHVLDARDANEMSQYLSLVVRGN